MADGADGNLNAGSLVLGVTALVGVIGSLTATATGTVGRVLRNEPGQFRLALVLVVLGAAVLGLSAIPVTSGSVDAIFSVAGLALTVTGLVVGGLAGARSAAQTELPSINAKLGTDGLHLEGTAKVGDVSSKAYLVLLVDGLNLGEDGKYVATHLIQSNVGPDGEGNVSVPVDLQLPAGRYDAVGMSSWVTAQKKHDGVRGTTEFNNRPCKVYSTREQQIPGPGCVVIPLPSAAASPAISLNWDGKDATANRLLLTVKADHAPVQNGAGAMRIAVQVKARIRGMNARSPRGPATRLLYRGLLGPDALGRIDATIAVPVSHAYELVCAQASFAHAKTGFATGGCPVTHARDPGMAFVELRSPGARLWKPQPVN